jgi:hypothetical protein
MAETGRKSLVPWAISNRTAALVIFGLSFAIRIGLVIALGTYHERERTELINTAVSIAEGHGLANAYGPGTGPTAHVTPLYPLLLSLVYRFFGEGLMGAFAQQVVGCAITSLGYALLPFVAAVIDLPHGVGVSSGLLAALLPINFWAERGTYADSLAGLFIAITFLYCGRQLKKSSLTWRWAVQAGIFFGVVWLSTPVLIPFVAAALLFTLYGRGRSRVAACSLLVLSAGLVVAPWVVRNYLVLGSPVLTRSNLGLELSISNMDGAMPTLEQNGGSGGVHSKRHPYDSWDERGKVARLGEIAYNRERMQEAETWIGTHPRKFVMLTFSRFAHFWFPVMLRPPQTLLIWMITALGAVGFSIYGRRQSRAKIFPCLAFVLYPLPYYILETSSRYRFPLESTILLFACFWLSCVLSFVQTRLGRSRGSASAVY